MHTTAVHARTRTLSQHLEGLKIENLTSLSGYSCTCVQLRNCVVYTPDGDLRQIKHNLSSPTQSPSSSDHDHQQYCFRGWGSGSSSSALAHGCHRVGIYMYMYRSWAPIGSTSQKSKSPRPHSFRIREPIRKLFKIARRSRDGFRRVCPFGGTDRHLQ